MILTLEYELHSFKMNLPNIRVNSWVIWFKLFPDTLWGCRSTYVLPLTRDFRRCTVKVQHFSWTLAEDVAQ